MTDEQKELLIAKMLESPSALSDEEIDAILHDDELREICEVQSSVSAAYHRLPEIDADEEWRRFRPRMRRKPSVICRIMRVAAIFAGVVLMSGIMVKIIDTSFMSDDKPIIAKAKQPATPVNDAPAAETAQDSAVQREETPASTVRKGTASAPKQYLAKAETAKPEKMKPAGEDEADDMDIDEYLRIQQARIDNELAIMAATEITEKYGPLLEMLDILGESDNILAVTIRKTTTL